MKLDSLPPEKQKLVMIGLIAVVVIIVGYLVYSNIFAGSGGPEMAPPMNPSAQTPGGMTSPPGGPPGSVPPGPGAPMPPSGGAPPPGAPAATPGPAPKAPPSAAPSAPPASPAPGNRPSAPAPSPAAPAPAKPAAPKVATKTITVFGTITVTYPSGWGIDLRSAGSAAVLTDGKARFELHAPDPKAANAKAIADSALRTIAKGAKVTAQGATKISGFDAYQYTTGATRIVGIDAPTRIVVVESAKGGGMAAYRGTFDMMESQLRFK